MLVSLGPIDVMALPADRRSSLLGVARSLGYAGGYAGLGSWLSSFINRNKNTISSVLRVTQPITSLLPGVNTAADILRQVAEGKIQQAQAEQQLKLLQDQQQAAQQQTQAVERQAVSPWVIGVAIVGGLLLLRGR